MQDTLFDLDTVGTAEPTKADPLATKLAARLTQRTVGRSRAIGAWFHGRQLRADGGDLTIGTSVFCEYGRRHAVAGLLPRTDGDVSLLLDAGGKFGGKEIELCVRVESDGSFVSATGTRFVREDMLPVPGEDSGPVIAVNVGDLCVGVGFRPQFVTARRGRWGYTQDSHDDEESVCFFGQAIRVPGELIADGSGPLSEVVIDRVATVFEEQVIRALGRLPSGGFDACTIKDLWALYRRIPEELRGGFPAAGGVQQLSELFEFEVSSPTWTGFASVDLFYGWKVDIKGEAVHLATSRKQRFHFDIWASSQTEFGKVWDRAERVALVVAELDRQARLSAAGTPSTSGPAPRKSKPLKISGEAVESLRETARKLMPMAVSVQETEELRKVVEYSGEGPLSAKEFAVLRAGVDLIQRRLGEEGEREAAALLALPSWSAPDLQRAGAIVESVIRGELSWGQQIHELARLHAALTYRPAIEEVAPGHWVCLNTSEIHSGRYGAVSCSGFYSITGGGAATPLEAAQQFVAQGVARVEKWRDAPEAVAHWLRNLRPPLEYNDAYQLVSYLSYRQQMNAVSATLAEGLSILDAEAITDLQAIALQQTLRRFPRLDPVESFAAQVVGEALAGRFGEAPTEKDARGDQLLVDEAEAVADGENDFDDGDDGDEADDPGSEDESEGSR